MLYVKHTFVMRFGNNVRHLREKRGMTTAQLGELAGMQQGNLSKIENGRAWIGEKKLTALASALEVPVSLLFSDMEDENSPIRTLALAEIGSRKLPVWDYPTAATFAYSSSLRSGRSRELPKDQPYVLTDRDYSKNSFGLKISDDAMAPLFTPGMVAIIDPDRKPEPNKVVAVLVRKDAKADEIVLRVYHDRGTDDAGQPIYEAAPRNRAYRTYFSEKDDISIVGMVAEQRSYFF